MAAGHQHAVGALARALRTKVGSTRPLHITRMIRTLVAYLIRAEPARSAARYEHQLQRKPTILGSNFVRLRLYWTYLRGDLVFSSRSPAGSSISAQGNALDTPTPAVAGSADFVGRVPEISVDLGENLLVVKWCPRDDAGRASGHTGAAALAHAVTTRLVPFFSSYSMAL